MDAEQIIILIVTVALFGLPFWAKLFKRFSKSQNDSDAGGKQMSEAERADRNNQNKTV